MPDQSPNNRRRNRLYTRLITFVILLAIAMLKPKVDAWLGRDLPVADDEVADVVLDEDVRDSDQTTDTSSIFKKSTQKPSAGTAKTTETPSTKVVEAKPNPAEQRAAERANSSTKPGRQADKSTANRTASETARVTKPKKPASDEPPPGKLQLVKGTRDEFQSTAGLMYVRGSRDGHRLKHVLKHAEDDRSKPVHGVFDGDRDDILAWIDRAYVKGKAGGKGTRVKEQGGRTVFTVDLGEKIGHVGGQVGDRKGHPVCRCLRLVIQNGNEVVTAYPSQSL